MSNMNLTRFETGSTLVVWTPVQREETVTQKDGFQGETWKATYQANGADPYLFCLFLHMKHQHIQYIYLPLKSSMPDTRDSFPTGRTQKPSEKSPPRSSMSEVNSLICAEWSALEQIMNLDRNLMQVMLSHWFGVEAARGVNRRFQLFTAVRQANILE
jgi:hypothetical protein